MSAARQDDAAVVDAFRAGDEGALAELYARWSPLVYSLALRSLGGVDQAEEVTRAVFTAAWAGRETFDPARTRFAHWLVELACSSIAGTKIEESAGRESKTGVLAEQMVVADGLSHLDTSSRRVLRMALDHDLTLGEIAGRTGISVEQVRSQVATSLNELRQQLEAQADAH